MGGKETRRKRIRQTRRSILRFDAPVLVFLLAGWSLIFATATLGLQRKTQQWLPVNLAAQVSADYSVDQNILEVKRVAPEIVEQAKQDEQAEQITPTPLSGIPIPEDDPIIVVTPTPTPHSGALTVSAGGPYKGEEGSQISLMAGGFDSVLTILSESVTYWWDLDNDGLYDDAVGITTTITFNDEGEYPVSVQAADAIGRVATDVALVNVSNVRNGRRAKG